MYPLRLAPLAACLLLTPVSASGQEQIDPFKFFEGRTENSAIVKVVLKKPYRTRTVGRGRIEADGSLTMIQTVTNEGKPPQERRWKVRKQGPGRYTASMSDAVGPVTITRVGNRYRFTFTAKGKLAVEQWLTPLPGGTSAKNTVKVRKMGVVVATTEGVIRKVAGK
jgi:hypothetical protein